MRALTFTLLYILLIAGVCKAELELSDDVDLLGGLQSPSKQVKVLTSATFEHDTQASTGMTTGDWFVMFYADFCGHCRRLKPTWEELAKHYDHHKTSIALVESNDNDDLRRRFKIRSFPTLILFRGGQMYRYPNTEGRDLKSLEKFISEPIYSVAGEPIPAPLSMLDEVLLVLNTVEYNDFVALYDEWPSMFLVCAGMVVITFIALFVACFGVCVKGKIVAPPPPKVSDRKTK